MKISSKYVSEFLGTAGLLMTVVGSGIMGESLAQGNHALALLANSLATGAGLFALIQIFRSLSGAHFNPVVSGAEWFSKRLSTRDVFGYIVAQFCGAIVGVGGAHAMFGQALFQVSSHNRGGVRFLISEAVATFGLILAVSIPGRKNSEAVPLTVALYITSAYWCTSSTSFANPAVTVARSLTNTFSGIAWTDVFGFVGAQIVGALVAVWMSVAIFTER